MARDQNTHAKRAREMEKRRKAEEKRARRRRKKDHTGEFLSPEVDAAVDMDNLQREDVEV